MLKVGLTGGIGSGKTLIGKMLESLGYPVFYSDEQAKVLADTDPEIKKKLVSLFGQKVYTQAGLNRPFLAEKIFGDEELRQQVNQIIHPKVRNAFDSFCKRQSAPLVFNEAAILIETDAYKKFDAIVLISAHEDVRINRVLQRDGATQESIRQRIQKQWTDDQKRPYADFEIVNDEDNPVLIQVENVINQLINSELTK